MEITAALEGISHAVAQLPTTAAPTPTPAPALDYRADLAAIAEQLRVVSVVADRAVAELARCPCPPDYTTGLAHVINELTAIQHAVDQLDIGLPERTAALQTLARVAAERDARDRHDQDNAAARAEEAAHDLEQRRHALLTELRDSYGWSAGTAQALL